MYCVFARGFSDSRLYLGLVTGNRAAGIEQWSQDDYNPPHVLSYDDLPVLMLETYGLLNIQATWIKGYARMDKTSPHMVPSIDPGEILVSTLGNLVIHVAYL